MTAYYLPVIQGPWTGTDTSSGSKQISWLDRAVCDQVILNGGMELLSKKPKVSDVQVNSFVPYGQTEQAGMLLLDQCEGVRIY